MRYLVFKPTDMNLYLCFLAAAWFYLLSAQTLA